MPTSDFFRETCSRWPKKFQIAETQDSEHFRFQKTVRWYSVREPQAPVANWCGWTAPVNSSAPSANPARLPPLKFHRMRRKWQFGSTPVPKTTSGYWTSGERCFLASHSVQDRTKGQDGLRMEIMWLLRFNHRARTPSTSSKSPRAGLASKGCFSMRVSTGSRMIGLPTGSGSCISRRLTRERRSIYWFYRSTEIASQRCTCRLASMSKTPGFHRTENGCVRVQ